MCEQDTYSPGFLDWPFGWPVGKSIGPVVINYDGPSLQGATITLSFTGDQPDISGTFVEDFSVEFPNRHVITFPTFKPVIPNTPNNIINTKVNILYDENVIPDNYEVPLFYDEWQLSVLET